VQDADNLAWKLALVLAGKAPDALLDTYCSEREHAADDNLLNSTRSTDFITPKSDASRNFRDAVLSLAREHPFARGLVNSGRLSMPATFPDSPLNTPDHKAFAAGVEPGAVALDAPVACNGKPGWFLEHVGGTFTVVCFASTTMRHVNAHLSLSTLAVDAVPATAVVIVMHGAAIDTLPGSVVVDDVEGLLAARYDARPGTCYVFRPDQHVCARTRAFSVDWARAAIARATCHH
jgi:3-(3-hydroxy-phenyl)propionate hydroxylase